MEVRNVSDIATLPKSGGGIMISFYCEHCGGCEEFPMLYLAITQHKGQTYIQWINNPLNNQNVYHSRLHKFGK